MRELDNLSGKEFGVWKVLEFDHMEWYGADHAHGMSYYKCKCKRCGSIKLVSRAQLICAKNTYCRRCKR